MGSTSADRARGAAVRLLHVDAAGVHVNNQREKTRLAEKGQKKEIRLRSHLYFSYRYEINN